MLVKLIAIMLLAALLLPMLGGIRRIRDLPKPGANHPPAPPPDADGVEDDNNRPA